MAAKIFVWVGHPRENSLSHGLADAYIRGAQSQGAEVRRMNLHDMQFDPDLTYGSALVGWDAGKDARRH